MKLLNLLKFRRKSPSPRSILFVCTANVTRSPVAEALFRDVAAESGEGWEISSAGINGTRGIPPNPIINFIMFQRGQAVQEHRSKIINRKILSDYRWIIVMEESHRRAILKLDDNLKDRIFLFRELSAEGLDADTDMPDPTGKDVDDYQELFNILDTEIPKLFIVMQNKAAECEWGYHEYSE